MLAYSVPSLVMSPYADVCLYKCAMRTRLKGVNCAYCFIIETLFFLDGIVETLLLPFYWWFGICSYLV